MPTLLRRPAVFKRSPFTDAFIAQLQQSFATDLNPDDKVDRAMLKRYYDHLQPFASTALAIDAHCVIACDAHSQSAYFKRLPAAFDKLFSHLNVEQVYFLDFLNLGFKDFPFENFAKRNAFKRLVGSLKKAAVLAVLCKDFTTILPLFYFSKRYERSAITFIADGAVPVAFRLCKDGNFHINYQAAHQDLIERALQTAGFMTGDIDLCWDYKIHCLPN